MINRAINENRRHTPAFRPTEQQRWMTVPVVSDRRLPTPECVSSRILFGFVTKRRPSRSGCLLPARQMFLGPLLPDRSMVSGLEWLMRLVYATVGTASCRDAKCCRGDVAAGIHRFPSGKSCDTAKGADKCPPYARYEGTRVHRTGRQKSVNPKLCEFAH
jgi:hypothetical protein